MNIDLSNMPATIDMLHLILAILSLGFLMLFIKKTSARPNNPEAIDEEKPAPVESPSPAKLTVAKPDSALQLLTLLQQDARFIDFIKEDLSNYSDADIGAAARVVHEGGKKTLDAYFTFEAIRSEEEETRISLPKGFNASEVRLTGNVVGEAPFTGTLIHKGWKVSETKLPKISDEHDTSIVAMAEVEL